MTVMSHAASDIWSPADFCQWVWFLLDQALPISSQTIEQFI